MLAELAVHDDGTVTLRTFSTWRLRVRLAARRLAREHLRIFATIVIVLVGTAFVRLITSEIQLVLAPLAAVLGIYALLFAVVAMKRVAPAEIAFRPDHIVETRYGVRQRHPWSWVRSAIEIDGTLEIELDDQPPRRLYVARTALASATWVRFAELLRANVRDIELEDDDEEAA